MHDITLITTIAFGLTGALVLGLLAKRFGLAPIVGYLVAGMIVGPYTPGFVGDVGLAKQLAEIGVILLMFGVGLHFHWDELMAVRWVAVPGALGQSIVATLFGLILTLAIGWSWNAGLVLGIAISVASTVVLLRVLEDHGMVETTEGRVAVGWLVVEDLITVVVLVLVPALAVDSGSTVGQVLSSAGWAIAKLLLLAGLVIVVGSRVVPWLLLRVARLRSRELFTLAVLVVAMAIATIGYVAFGASMALGAFLAGMVVAQSKVSHQAAADALPMRDAFAVLFFVSVGMLFDYRQVFAEPWLVLGLLGVILIIKPLVALAIVIATRNSLRTGLTVAGGLAQIGEFSFIVAEAARTSRIMPDSGHHALVAAAILSISLNPAVFKWMLALEPWVQRHPKLNAWLQRRTDARGQSANKPKPSHGRASGRPRAIIVGYGPVGQSATRRVTELGLEPYVIDINVDTILELQSKHVHALYGNARRREILVEAGIVEASFLIVTVPDVTIAIEAITAARAVNPRISVLARTRYTSDSRLLLDAGAESVVSDEAETSTALSVFLRAQVLKNAPAVSA